MRNCDEEAIRSFGETDYKINLCAKHLPASNREGKRLAAQFEEIAKRKGFS